LRDPKSPDGVTDDPRGALKSKSTWTDEDGVGRVKRDGGIKDLAETGYASTSRRSRGGQAEMDGLGGLGLKTTRQAAFLVWASKPRARPVWPGVRDGGHVAPSRSLH